MAAAVAALLLASKARLASWNAVMLFRRLCPAIDGVHGVPSDAGDRLAGSHQLRQVQLNRVDAGDVMHYDADLSSVMGNARLPLGLGKGGRECGQCRCSSFETGSERFGSMIHFLHLLRAETKTLCKNPAAAVRAPDPALKR